MTSNVSLPSSLQTCKSNLYSCKQLTACLDSPRNVIRPSKGSNKPKKSSSLRASFGLGGTSMLEDDDSAPAVVFTPKKSNLSRQAVEKNALRKSLASTLSSEHLPYRQTDERPSYSKDYLDELKTSTPSTPKDLKSLSDVEDGQSKALDLAAKFGSDLEVRQNSAIPTDAEIREKKERRARLAKEEEYINISDDEDESNEISLLPRTQKPETRLVRDDEDIAEGFDEFVDDGRIALGRKAEREQKRRQAAQIRELINEAEGSSDDDTDDSEAERKAAYEAAQTRAGMDGLHKEDPYARPRRPKTPPKITPLPTLTSCLERLQANLASMQYAKMQKIKRMEELQREKADIAVREEEIQRLLKEAGENYDKLRNEAGLAEGEYPNEQRMIGDGTGTPGRGLESIGHTPVASEGMSP